ncbi:MAG: DUF3810 domain-containing protein [Firmicutes bacterium]|nr:DUF3810 domain-containing protein [Bacillota bacterium]
MHSLYEFHKKFIAKNKANQLAKPIKENKRLFIKLTIAIGASVAFLIFLIILRATSVSASEFITVTISNFLVSFVGFFTSVIPIISIGEIFLFGGILLVVFGISLSIYNLKDKKRTLVLRRVMLAILVTVNAFSYFMLTTGFSYNRADISNGIMLSDSVPRDDEITTIANFFMDDFIYVGESLKRCENGFAIVNYSFFRLGEMMRDEFRRLENRSYFFDFTPRPKIFLNSWWFSTVGVAGMAFTPFGEGTTNFMPPTIGNIFTMAHEFAHTAGVMRENDANLVAYYVLITSKNPLFRYVGYIYSMSHLVSAIFLGNNLDRDIQTEFRERWPIGARQDRNNISQWWTDYREANWINRVMREVGNFFNNLYLILSGVSDGTGNYQNFPDGYDRDPDSPPDRPVFIPRYNNVQRMYFAVWEAKQNL